MGGSLVIKHNYGPLNLFPQSTKSSVSIRVAKFCHSHPYHKKFGSVVWFIRGPCVTNLHAWIFAGKVIFENILLVVQCIIWIMLQNQSVFKWRLWKKYHFWSILLQVQCWCHHFYAILFWITNRSWCQKNDDFFTYPDKLTRLSNEDYIQL